MRVRCANCQGTGIGDGMRARFGELMNLCTRCDGEGVLDTDAHLVDPRDRAFVAIFPVSDRYVVHMRIPRRKGGVVPMDIEWSPRMPPKRGRGQLTNVEAAAYERGRNAALAALMHQLGGGDYSVMKPEERH